MLGKLIFGNRLRAAAGFLMVIFLAGAIVGTAQDGTLFVKGRKVGINSADPPDSLYVTSIDGTARILVDETAASEAKRDLFSLKNNGRTSFRFEDVTQGVAWRFQTREAGFEMRKEDFPVPSLKLESGGSVKMGNGDVINLTLEDDGDLKIEGKLSEGSSRAIKSDVVGVDTDSLLERLEALPLYEWSYREDGSGVRHIGPMAEEFEAAFGLGADPAHLAPSDTAGVALAAVQGLQLEVQEKAARIAALERHNAALEDRLARLEAALASGRNR